MASPVAELVHDRLNAVIGGGPGLTRFRQTIWSLIGGWTEGNYNVHQGIGQWAARFRMDDGKLQVMTRYGEDGVPSRWKTVGHAPKQP